jgi:nucleoside-diphosphate-sugar epimerase
MTSIVVIGATGRIGRAVLPFLRAGGAELRLAPRDMVDRAMANDTDDLVEVAQRSTAILNLAGRAHLQSGSPDLDDLRRANVELPLRLLEVATAAETKLVHVSSTKANATDSKSNAYAKSKALAESLLRDAANRTGTAPVVAFRTCAVMAPPYDAGKLSLVKRVRFLPSAVVPNITVPVISPETLALLLRKTVDLSLTEPFSVVEVPRHLQMSLRQVIERMRSQP